jgi:hypothetical protein
MTADKSDKDSISLELTLFSEKGDVSDVVEVSSDTELSAKSTVKSDMDAISLDSSDELALSSSTILADKWGINDMIGSFSYGELDALLLDVIMAFLELKMQ